MIYKVYSILVTLIFALTVACSTTRDITLYVYDVNDDFFYIDRDENEGIPPADADGLIGMFPDDWQKVLERLNTCEGVIK